jgi:hypothetical protein
MLEDVADYKGFEAAIIADYDAETAVERELVLRLASLLWRIRRATSIETNLLGIHAEILRDSQMPSGRPDLSCDILSVPNPLEELSSPAGEPGPRDFEAGHHHDDACPSGSAASPHRTRAMLCSFQQLINFDSATFERLGRYESALARQIVQIMFLLQSARRRRF